MSLTALVAWNGRELGLDTADLVDAIAARWDGELCTWVDARRGRRRRRAGSARSKRCCRCWCSSNPTRSRRSPTRTRSAAPFGPAGVHRAEPAFDRRRYWRGPVWPQLAYLLWLAGAPVAETTVRGAASSGLAEFWDPDDGTGLGASPQSWTCLALVMSAVRDVPQVECWFAVAA